MIDWTWVIDNADQIAGRTLQHVQLTAIALGVGFVLSMAAALLVIRRPRAYGPITAATAAMYTIPSLALFAFFVPITGLSVLTAEIGLVSYTLLILIRNIVAGLRVVPPDVVEAAAGMGYTRRQLLWRVQLPLATPVIVAGLRIAAVTTIGLVTVTALIGQGGLGFFINRGLELVFSPVGTTMIIVGTALSLVLAVVVDLALVGTQRLLTPWTRPRRAA